MSDFEGFWKEQERVERRERRILAGLIAAVFVLSTALVYLVRA